MAEQFSAEWAKGIIDDNVQKAQAFIDDPERINGLLGQLQEKLQTLPETVRTAFGNVPAMAQMVKCYITREYTNVSPKVVVSLVAAFIYLVKKDDLIPDNIPILGFADDLAVATVAMAINEREIQEFLVWRDMQDGYLVPTEDAGEAEIIATEDVIETEAAAAEIADAKSGERTAGEVC